MGSWKIIAMRTERSRGQRAHRRFALGQKVLAIEGDARSLVQCGVVRQQAPDGARCDRLAGTRLADDRQRLAGHHVEGDPAYRVHLAVVRAKAHVQVLDRQQQRGIRVRHGDRFSWDRPTDPSRRASRRRAH